MGTFELKTDNDILDFIESQEHGLVVATGTKRGTIKELHILSTQELPQDKLFISGGLVLKRNSNFPLIERLVLQWRPIIKAATQSQDKAKEIEKSLLDIALCISKIEELLLNYGNLLFESKKKIRTQHGVSVQPSGHFFDDPTLNLRSIASDAIIHFVICLRKLPNLLEQITSMKFSKDEKFIDEIAGILPNDSQDREAIEKDKKWIGELWYFRGQIEHSRWDIIPFSIVPFVLAPSKFDGVDCTVHSKAHGGVISLGAWLNTTLMNIISFIEDILLISVSRKMPPYVTIGELPEKDREKNEFRRFMLYMTK